MTVKHILLRNGTQIGIPLPASCQGRPFAGFARGLEPRFPSFETVEAQLFLLLDRGNGPQPFLNLLVSGYCQLGSTLTSEAQSVEVV